MGSAPWEKCKEQDSLTSVHFRSDAVRKASAWQSRREAEGDMSRFTLRHPYTVGAGQSWYDGSKRYCIQAVRAA